MKKILTVVFVFTLLGAGFCHAGTIQLPKTGQTTPYSTGDDGTLQKGIGWIASTRFNDNGNGTITDKLTGLIWLKNASCLETIGGVVKYGYGYVTWANAITWCNNLASGSCGLTDASTAGQWRLPNITELESLVDAERYNPALPSSHPFSNVQADNYWSSSRYAISNNFAWVVSLYYGTLDSEDKVFTGGYVWPVRVGQ